MAQQLVAARLGRATEFDLVIVDTPPVLGDDTGKTASLAHSVVLVVGHGHVSRTIDRGVGDTPSA